MTLDDLPLVRPLDHPPPPEDQAPPVAPRSFVAAFAAALVVALMLIVGIVVAASGGRAGRVTFRVHNAGTMRHEFVVLRTAKAADAWRRAPTVRC